MEMQTEDMYRLQAEFVVDYTLPRKENNPPVPFSCKDKLSG
jgi:hypothetical protein